MGHIDVPLVRAQIRRGNIVQAARIFKQGELCCCRMVCMYVVCIYVLCGYACMCMCIDHY